WSESSVASDWVKTEAAEAARRRILVPALIDDVRVPFEFRRIQAARLVGWTGDQTHEEFARLIQAIAATIGGMPDRPPAPAVSPNPLRGAVATRVADPAPRSRRRPATLIGAAAALVVALAALLYLRFREQEPVVVGVMEIRPRSNAPPWMCDLTRD